MERVNSEDSILSGTELDEPCVAFKKQSNQPSVGAKTIVDCRQSP